jgi:hypothetical protein
MSRTEFVALKMIENNLPDFIWGIVSNSELEDLIREKVLQIVVDSSIYCDRIAVRFAESELMTHLRSTFPNGSFFERTLAMKFFCDASTDI